MSGQKTLSGGFTYFCIDIKIILRTIMARCRTQEIQVRSDVVELLGGVKEEVFGVPGEQGGIVES